MTPGAATPKRWPVRSTCGRAAESWHADACGRLQRSDRGCDHLAAGGRFRRTASSRCPTRSGSLGPPETVAGYGKGKRGAATCCSVLAQGRRRRDTDERLARTLAEETQLVPSRGVSPGQSLCAPGVVEALASRAEIVEGCHPGANRCFPAPRGNTVSLASGGVVMVAACLGLVGSSRRLISGSRITSRLGC
jgi:hypothetical protein